MKKLVELMKKQVDYVASCGGYFSIHEADEYYNDLNREIIKAFKEEYGTSYIGSVNINGVPKEKIESGEHDVFTEYTGQFIYNSGCTFIVPCRDEILETMIREWNCSTCSGGKIVEKIVDRISAIGGIYFIWF